jgi:transcriptional regulator with XRE-family HTH domain
MAPSPAHVNVSALYGALEDEKNTRHISWRQLARECHLSPSTLTRLANGHRPDVDAFAALVGWLGQPAEAFMTASSDQQAGREPDIVLSLAPLLRARKDLNDEDVEHLQVLFTAAVEQFRANKATR